MSAEELPSSHPLASRVRRSAGLTLTLVGVSADGRTMRLALPGEPDGPELRLEIDEQLRAALGRPSAESPAEAGRDQVKVETPMESMLRPRDIQARIRAGETPEAVAAAAQTSVERVMPFAAPVLAEREHVAERAQRSSVRRRAGESTASPRALGEAITAHLQGRNVDAEAVVWDAWRREDGRWSLTGRYSVPGRDGLADLTFDPRGNFVVLDNDDARWLVGDLPDPGVLAEPDQLSVRRLAAVPREEPRSEPGDPDELALGLSATDQPLEAFLDPGDPAPDEHAGDRAHDHLHEPPSRRPVRKTRGRASVPSWDEIMFGSPND